MRHENCRGLITSLRARVKDEEEDANSAHAHARRLLADIGAMRSAAIAKEALRQSRIRFLQDRLKDCERRTTAAEASAAEERRSSAAYKLILKLTMSYAYATDVDV